MNKLSASNRIEPTCTGKTILKYVWFLLGLTISNQVCASSLTVTGLSGINSNPLTLSDQHDPGYDVFLYGDIKFSGNYNKNIYLKAYARQTIFIDDDRANKFKSKVDLAYKSKFKIGTKDIRYELSTDITNRDKTYVSKTTGNEATFNSQSIKDRYDYVNYNYNAGVSYRNENRIKFKLQYQLRDKNYTNYSIPGLSNFDYEHNRFSLSMDYPASDRGRLIVEIGATRRDFIDKRADDLNGNDIPNTDLEYDYNSYEFDYYYKYSKDLRFKGSLDYTIRSDNAVGYSDSSLVRLTFSEKYSLSDQKTLTASLIYSDFSYDNRNVVDELSLEEEDFNRKGFSLNLRYQKILSRVEDSELSLYVLLEIDDIDSSDPIYRYQRNSIAFGVRYELF